MRTDHAGKVAEQDATSELERYVFKGEQGVLTEVDRSLENG